MILTESDLRAAASEAKSVITESVLLKSAHFDYTKTYDLFISHSFKDKELVSGLRYRFMQCGYNVYIDWIEDKELDRGTVTAKTADVIKKRLAHCKGLAYVATANITNSKWCPWELGLADGKLGRACILPVMSSSSFKGAEYLGLYPYMDMETVKDKIKKEFWINDPDDEKKYVRLRKWLEGAEPGMYIH